jgi:hypothetical protein
MIGASRGLDLVTDAEEQRRSHRSKREAAGRIDADFTAAGEKTKACSGQEQYAAESNGS